MHKEDRGAQLKAPKDYLRGPQKRFEQKGMLGIAEKNGPPC